MKLALQCLSTTSAKDQVIHGQNIRPEKLCQKKDRFQICRFNSGCPFWNPPYHLLPHIFLSVCQVKRSEWVSLKDLIDTACCESYLSGVISPQRHWSVMPSLWPQHIYILLLAVIFTLPCDINTITVGRSNSLSQVTCINSILHPDFLKCRRNAAISLNGTLPPVHRWALPDIKVDVPSLFNNLCTLTVGPLQQNPATIPLQTAVLFKTSLIDYDHQKVGVFLIRSSVMKYKHLKLTIWQVGSDTV